MNKATLEYINQWLFKANEDLLVVSKLTEFEIIATSSVCFHCQQAVEKFLKAFLIANGVEIKKRIILNICFQNALNLIRILTA